MSYKTNINKDKRKQLKSMMDEFTSFNWAGHFMYEDFGAFIVGGKDALKFYNGPKFTNQYAKPQFEGAAPLLTGVNFDTQKIEFTMGVYWFTIEEYRQLLMLLHPYEVNDLGFDFDTKWRYYAKLNSYQDSPRHFLGYDADGNRRYYTEIKLTFEVQGDSGMLARQSYEIESASDGKGNIIQELNDQWFYTVFQWKSTDSTINKGIPRSDLDTPFQLFFSVNTRATGIAPIITLFPESYLFPLSDSQIDTDTKGYYIHLAASIPLSTGVEDESNIENEIGLCSIYLNNLSWINEDNTASTFPQLNFCFDSQTGLLTLQTGSGAYRLLSLTSSSGTGSRILQALETNKCFLPGALSSGVSQELFNKIKFKIYYTSNLILGHTYITSYARTNII